MSHPNFWNPRRYELIEEAFNQLSDLDEELEAELGDYDYVIEGDASLNDDGEIDLSMTISIKQANDWFEGWNQYQDHGCSDGLEVLNSLNGFLAELFIEALSDGPTPKE